MAMMCAVQFEGGSLGARFTRRTPPPIIPQCALPRRRNTKQEDKILDARLHVSHITVPVCRGAWFFRYVLIKFRDMLPVSGHERMSGHRPKGQPDSARIEMLRDVEEKRDSGLARAS